MLRHTAITNNLSARRGLRGRLPLPLNKREIGENSMKHDHRSGPARHSALHLLHRAGQCAEVLFTNEAAKADLTPRQYRDPVCVPRTPTSARPAWSSRRASIAPRSPTSCAGSSRRACCKESARGATRACMRSASRTKGPVCLSQRQTFGVEGRSAHSVGAEVRSAGRLHRLPRRDREGDEPLPRGTGRRAVGRNTAATPWRALRTPEHDARRHRCATAPHPLTDARSMMARVSAQSNPWP